MKGQKMKDIPLSQAVSIGPNTRALLQAKGEALPDGQLNQESYGKVIRTSSAGKPRFELLVPKRIPYDKQMLTRFAKHMGDNAGRYEAPRNWEQDATPEGLERFQESAFRHFMQWLTGVDDGEDHAAAVWFNIMGAEYCKELMS